MSRHYFALVAVNLLFVFLPGIGAVSGQKPDHDFKDIDLTKAGIPAVPAMKDANTGFIVGGKNSTELIGKLTEINGLSVARLESVMRPKKLSQSGFLGADEKLVDILVADNKVVVDERGLTHQQLAWHLHAMGVIAAMLEKKANAMPVEFVYHGRRFRVTRFAWRGYQASPFEDETKSNADAEVTNLANAKKIKYGLLVPYMIERYGFYEGKGTKYRVEPSQVLAVLDFVQAENKKK